MYYAATAKRSSHDRESTDTGRFTRLRREALQEEPLAFGSSTEDDRLSFESAEKALADAANQAVFGLYADNRLMGMVGIMRTDKVKEKHKAHIWGMYVSRALRRNGAGKALLNAAIQKANEWPGVSQIHLTVTETAVEAKHLYERAGFLEWGREPKALCSGGTVVDEHHFVLQLSKP